MNAIPMLQNSLCLLHHIVLEVGVDMDVRRDSDLALGDGPCMAAMHTYDSTYALNILEHLFTIHVFWCPLHHDAEQLPEEANCAGNDQNGECKSAERVQDIQAWVNPEKTAGEDHEAVLHGIRDKVEPRHVAGNATMAVTVVVHVARPAKPNGKAAVNNEGAGGGEADDAASAPNEHVGRGQAFEGVDDQIARNDVLTDEGNENADNFQPVETKRVALAVSSSVGLAYSNKETGVHCNIGNEVETVAHEGQGAKVDADGNLDTEEHCCQECTAA